jgi:hypothetical protein
MIAIGILLLCLGVVGLLAVAYYGSNTLVSTSISTPVNVTSSNSGTATINPSVYGNLMRNLVTDFTKTTYASPGEQLYLSGVDADGLTITATFVGKGMPMQGMMNRHLVCANCHGQNGRGDFLFPDGTTKSADIRWSTLAAAGYDQAKFATAVTQGKDQSGNALSGWMPQWKISDADLADLAAYLKTL